MKRQLSILICILIFYSKSEKCFASHGVGAELTYTCMGSNNYRFNFVLYRDCDGIAVNPFYTITGESTCGGIISFDVNLDSIMEISNVCNNVATRCVNAASQYEGVEVSYYHGDVTIPSSCNYWTFGIYPICNRNVSLTNLQNGGASWCLYVEAILNNDSMQCNNSPAFNGPPLMFLCVNNVQYYNLKAFDIDGDSLVYRMIYPHSDSQTDVVYINGLSAKQPVTYDVPDSTRFDSLTGEIRFVANAQQVTAIAVQVDEYRNGVLIGSVERDIQLIFMNCSNNLPVISGVNGTINFTRHVCADSLVSFYIKTSDIDALDNTHLSWNGSIPSATFSTSNTHRDTGYFYWQTTLLDYRLEPYTFTVTVNDSACPLSGENTRVFRVYVDSCMFNSVGENENELLNAQAYYSAVDRSIKLKYKLNEAMLSLISLYDIAGREISNISVPKQTDYNGSLDVSTFAPGLYFLNIYTESGYSKSLKVIVE